MKIHALTVSVGYAEQLAQSIALWSCGLESLTVVTDSADSATQLLAARHGARCFVTDAFYENGAHFNKGAAMELARQSMPWEDWILFIDADVIPPLDWKEQLEFANLQPGWLYGCWRFDEQGRRLRDDSHGYGYFQLFHSSDPLANEPGLIQTCWTHAGNYDSFLMLRWRDAGKLAKPLPLRLTHPGGPNHNWYGKKPDGPALFQQMEQSRRRAGGGWKSIEGERLQRPAALDAYGIDAVGRGKITRQT